MSHWFPDNRHNREIDMNFKVGVDPARECAAVAYCSECHCEIDPDTCYCGEYRVGHGFWAGHGFIPMGCVCFYCTEGNK